MQRKNKYEVNIEMSRVALFRLAKNSLIEMINKYFLIYLSVFLVFVIRPGINLRTACFGQIVYHAWQRTSIGSRHRRHIIN